MEVLRGCEVIQIQVFQAQLEHGAGIGQDVPKLSAGQDDGQPGRSRTSYNANLRDVYSALSQTIHRDLSQRVVADPRNESDFAAYHREVVGEDSRGTSQGEGESVRQQFSFRFQFNRQ